MCISNLGERLSLKNSGSSSSGINFLVGRQQILDSCSAPRLFGALLQDSTSRHTSITAKHSCLPNAAWELTADPPEMRLVALYDIVDEEPTVALVDTPLNLQVNKSLNVSDLEHHSFVTVSSVAMDKTLIVLRW